MTASLPAPAPSISPETKPFWDATLDGKLLIKRCNPCQKVYWYPRAICPHCGSFDTAWVEASGKGTIYTFSVVRRPAGDYAGVDPYVLAYVELEEGPRMLTNVVDVDPQKVFVGQPVAVVFHNTGAEAALPRFIPAS